MVVNLTADYSLGPADSESTHWVQLMVGTDDGDMVTKNIPAEECTSFIRQIPIEWDEVIVSNRHLSVLYPQSEYPALKALVTSLQLSHKLTGKSAGLVRKAYAALRDWGFSYSRLNFSQLDVIASIEGCPEMQASADLTKEEYLSGIFNCRDLEAETDCGLLNLTVSMLKQLCQQEGLSMSGNKDELVAKLTEETSLTKIDLSVVQHRQICLKDDWMFDLSSLFDDVRSAKERRSIQRFVFTTTNMQPTVF
jgi:hypothetical protein